MRSWFVKNSAFAFLGYNDWRCFFYLHRDLFKSYANASSACDRLKYAKNVSVHRLHRLPLAIEFHAWSEWRFWNELMPRAPQLRARYARAGGTFLATTLMREPRKQIVSAFLERKPKARNATGEMDPVTRLQWLRHGTDERDVSPFRLPSGIQTRSLACKHPSTLGCAYAPPNSSRDELCETEVAVSNLYRLDLFCDFHSVDRFCQSVGVLTSTPAASWRSNRSTASARVELEEPEEEAALSIAARCDERLMGIVQPGEGCWDGAGRLTRAALALRS